MQSTTIRCSSLVHSQVLVFRIALKRFHFADGDSVTFKVMIFYSHVFSALSPNLKLMRFVFGCHFSKQFYSSSRSGNCLKLNQVFIPCLQSLNIFQSLRFCLVQVDLTQNLKMEGGKRK